MDQQVMPTSKKIIGVADIKPGGEVARNRVERRQEAPVLQKR